jgi:hypothetical protein
LVGFMGLGFGRSRVLERKLGPGYVLGASEVISESSKQCKRIGVRVNEGVVREGGAEERGSYRGREIELGR